jgi:hypothetical protein
MASSDQRRRTYLTEFHQPSPEGSRGRSATTTVSEKRRQRIYEMQFNRPYPKKANKNSQFWTEQGPSLLVEKYRVETFDRKWISSPQRPSSSSGDKKKTPSINIREIAPRNLWAYDDASDNAMAFDEKGDIPMNRRKENMLPTDRMEFTAPSLMTPIRAKDTAMTTMEMPPQDVTSPPIRAKDAVMTAKEMPPTEVTPPTTEEGRHPQVTPPKSFVGVTPTDIFRVDSTVADRRGTRRGSLASTATSNFLLMCSADDKNNKEKSPAFHLESRQTLYQFVKGNESNKLKLDIDDYQESTFDWIVESLYGNRSLKTLVVSRNKATSGNYKTTMEMDCFWEAMRCLPHLETLILFNLGQDVLMGLGVAIQNLLTLTHVELHLSQGTIRPSLLDVLRTLPKLSHIHLEVHATFDVASLLTCPNLQDLRIMSSNKVALESQQIQGLIARMEKHPTLKSLDLEPSMDTSSFVSLVQALHSNQLLQSLRVSISGDDDGKNNYIVVKELGRLMQSNSTLKHLWNHLHESLHVCKETMNNDVLKALKGNKAIQYFMFFHENFIFRLAKEQILKRNRENYDNTANGESLFQKYITGGLLTDIGIGIQDKWAASCDEIKEITFTSIKFEDPPELEKVSIPDDSSGTVEPPRQESAVPADYNGEIQPTDTGSIHMPMHVSGDLPENTGKTNGESLFKKYLAGGFLTDINIGIQDKCAAACDEIEEITLTRIKNEDPPEFEKVSIPDDSSGTVEPPRQESAVPVDNNSEIQKKDTGSTDTLMYVSGDFPENTASTEEEQSDSVTEAESRISSEAERGYVEINAMRSKRSFMKRVSSRLRAFIPSRASRQISVKTIVEAPPELENVSISDDSSGTVDTPRQVSSVPGDNNGEFQPIDTGSTHTPISVPGVCYREMFALGAMLDVLVDGGTCKESIFACRAESQVDDFVLYKELTKTGQLEYRWRHCGMLPWDDETSDDGSLDTITTTSASIEVEIDGIFPTMTEQGFEIRRIAL